jgi:hypothetical protein
LRVSLPVCFSVEAVWLGLVVEIPFLLMFVYDCRIPPCCSRIPYGWGVLGLRIKEQSTSRVTCWRSGLDTSMSRPWTATSSYGYAVEHHVWKIGDVGKVPSSHTSCVRDDAIKPDLDEALTQSLARLGIVQQSLKPLGLESRSSRGVASWGGGHGESKANTPPGPAIRFHCMLCGLCTGASTNSTCSTCAFQFP